MVPLVDNQSMLIYCETLTPTLSFLDYLCYFFRVPSADSDTAKRPLAVTLCAHYGERKNV